MDARQENKVSMFYKIRTFFTANLSTLAALITILTDKVTAFNDKLDELAGYDMEATENNTGYAIEKDEKRTDMRTKALAVSGGLFSWAQDSGNDILAQKVYTTKSALDLMRDTNVLYFCERLFNFATDNAAAIIPYGVTAAKLAALNTAIGNFKIYLQQPSDQRAESAASGRAVEKAITEIDAMLLVIDGLMATIAEDEPVLFDQYRLDRMIDDNASGPGTPPDVTTSLDPGIYIAVLDIPYLASRNFKAKNDSEINLQ